MSPRLLFPRAALVAGIVLLSLSACGRRGALEAPPDPAQAQQGAAATGTPQQGTLPSPVGTPRAKNANRGFTIPKTPFILDPLL